MVKPRSGGSPVIRPVVNEVGSGVAPSPGRMPRAMDDRPPGVSDGDVVEAVRDGWRLDVAGADYAPVGFGSYHWVVAGGDDRRWFVTVDDLDDCVVSGGSRDDTFRRLSAAFATAADLHDRFSLAVYPHLRGTPGVFSRDRTAQETAEVVDLLVALHGATGEVPDAPVHEIEPPDMEALEEALDALDRPWNGGPFSEPLRTALSERAERVRAMVQWFRELIDRVGRPQLVITHGEPHPGNTFRTPDGLKLIDWDTAALGPPERDLWELDQKALDHYATATHHEPHPDALELYRVRWDVADLSSYVSRLRRPHEKTTDATKMFHGVVTMLGDPED